MLLYGTPSEDNFMTLKMKGDVLIFTASTARRSDERLTYRENVTPSARVIFLSQVCGRRTECLL